MVLFIHLNMENEKSGHKFERHVCASVAEMAADVLKTVFGEGSASLSLTNFVNFSVASGTV